MPAQFLRRLTGAERTQAANRQLGAVLAFVAGAVNAGGYLAVQRCTSHMTGMITDLGIKLGRLCYWNRGGAGPRTARGKPTARSCDCSPASWRCSSPAT